MNKNPKRATARQAFKCTDCGLLISGRVDANGQIKAYDRAPTNDRPPRPFLCMTCAPRLP
jgi:hypothetical protein